MPCARPLGCGGHDPAGNPAGEGPTLLGDAIPDHARPSLGSSLRVSAVFLFHRLAPGEILDGLGMAEITPGR